MTKMHGQLKNQVEEMEKKFNLHENEIKKAYSIPEMKKNSYNLHSICVH